MRTFRYLIKGLQRQRAPQGQNSFKGEQRVLVLLDAQFSRMMELAVLNENNCQMGTKFNGVLSIKWKFINNNPPVSVGMIQSRVTRNCLRQDRTFSL